MRERVSGLSGRAREIADLLMAGGHGGELVRALWLPGVSHITEIFAPGGEDYAALSAVLGEDDARLAREMWAVCTNFPYQEYPRYSRSYRSALHSAAYIHNITQTIRAFILGVADGFTVERYLDERAKGESTHSFPFERRFVPNAIAAALDRRDDISDASMARIRDVLAVEASRGLDADDIISGILKSTRDDAIDMACSLLRGPDTSPSARNAVARGIDCGSRQAFLRILRCITDEDLTKYQCVARAFFSCTGIHSIASGVAGRVKELFVHARRCVEDDSYRSGALDSGDALDAAIALWGLSWHGIELAEAEARNMLRDGARRKKLAALCFASWLGLDGARHEIVRPCLDNPAVAGDAEMMAWAMECLKPDSGERRFIVSEGRSPYIRFVDHGAVRLTADELTDYFASLARLADAFPPKKRVFVSGDSVSRGAGVEYARSDVVGVMMDIASRSASPDWLDGRTMTDGGGEVAVRDKLCLGISEMDPPSRVKLISSVIKSGITPIQRRALISSLADRNSLVRAVAWEYAGELSDEETLEIEGFLLSKDEDVRRPILLKLLARGGEKIAESVGRLNGSGDDTLRSAGKELAAMAGQTAGGVGEMRSRRAGAEKPKPGRGQPAAASLSSAPAYSMPESPEELDFAASVGMGLDVSGLIAKISELCSAINGLIEQNRHIRYRVADEGGAEREITLGEGTRFEPLFLPGGSQRSLDAYPLSGEWREILRSSGVTGTFLFFASRAESFSLFCASPDAGVWGVMPGGAPLAEFVAEACRAVRPDTGQFAYSGKIAGVISAMASEFPGPDIYASLREVTLWAARNREKFASSGHGQRGRYSELLDLLFGMMREAASQPGEDEIFMDYFKIMYAWSYEESARDYLTLRDAERAYGLGLLPGREMTDFVMKLASRGNILEAYLGPDTVSPDFREAVIDPIVQRVADIGTEHGESAAEALPIVRTMFYIPGARHFLDILERIGDMPFDRRVRDRGHDWKGSEISILSHLLYYTYPAEGEDAAVFRGMAGGRGLTDAMLLNGAMFAPQWIEAVSEFLGWDGLEEACWFFQAHTYGAPSEYIGKMTARYSSVEMKDFRDGAVDVTWYKKTRGALGPGRMEAVMRASKQISSAAGFKRLRLFYDAMEGRVALGEAKRLVAERRSRNHAICCGLIPLDRSLCPMPRGVTGSCVNFRGAPRPSAPLENLRSCL